MTDETSIDIECLGDSTAQAVRLVAEVARSPSFPEAELARLKTDLIREMAIERSQPQPLAQEAFHQAIYGSHPYGRTLAQAQEVERFTLDQAKSLWTRYAGADQAHLYVVGRFDVAAVRAAIERGIRRLEQGQGPRPAQAGPPRREAGVPGGPPGAVQSTVRIGLPVVPPTSPDYIPLVVTNTLLGGSFGSRITANIREKHGLHLLAEQQVLGTHPGAGTWAESADVTTKDTAAALTRGGQRGRAAAEGAAIREELAGIQRYVAGIFVLRNSNRAGIVAQLRFVDLYGLPADWLRTYVQRVKAVTPADVTRTTKKYIDPSRMTLVVVGDRKVVEESLKQFGPVKIEAPR